MMLPLWIPIAAMELFVGVVRLLKVWEMLILVLHDYIMLARSSVQWKWRTGTL